MRLLNLPKAIDLSASFARQICQGPAGVQGRNN
jgi:hypothetical protein